MSKKIATRTRRACIVFALMTLPIADTRGVDAWAQQSPQQPNPAQTAPPPAAPPTTTPAAAPSAAPPPLPQPDVAYEMGSGIASPQIIQAAPAVYPNETPPRTSCFMRMTIGVDGLPYNIRSMTPDCGPYQAAAIAAVQNSKFQAGLLGQTPVPVRIEVRVHFSPDRSPALPQIMHNSNRQWDTPPAVMHSIDPEYSKEARKKKITGIVNVSTLINEEGVPTDLRVEKSLGYGLDEEAVSASVNTASNPRKKAADR